MTTRPSDIEIEFTLAESDLLVLATYQVENSDRFRRNIKQVRFGTLIGLGLMSVGLYLTQSNKLIAVLVAALALLFYAAAPALIRLRTRWRLPRIVRKQVTPTTLARQTLRITPQGIERQVAEGTSSLSWSQVDGLVEIPGYALLSVDGIFSMMVPREQVGEDDYATFVETVRVRRDRTKERQ